MKQAPVTQTQIQGNSITLYKISTKKGSITPSYSHKFGMPYLPRLLFPHWPGRMGPTRFQPNLVESMAMAAPWKGSVRMKGKRYPHTAEKRTTRREPVGPRWNWASLFFDETFLFFFPKPSNPPRGTGPTAQAPDFFLYETR